MKPFDLNQHFKTVSQNLFFNEKTYADLLKDVAAFSQIPFIETHIALQLNSTYYLMVALLGLINQKKTAILISPLETNSSLERLKEQIDFKTIINDQYFDSLNISIIPFSFSPLSPDEEAVIVFSSGTTNTSKGVVLSFNNLYFSALGFIEFFKQKETETTLMNLPHNHVGGLMSLWRCFFSGGRLVTEDSIHFDFISLVPLQLKRWIENPTKLDYLKSCRVILIGGAPLFIELKQSAQLAGLNLFETYGMSESTSLVTINGEILPYREVTLDADGFFLIKGKILSLGYYQNQNFKAHGPDWFKTNDQGIKLSNGLYCFKNRADLIFISGGENINPLMVEEIARKHPAITDAYLLSITDEKWGELGIMLYQGNNISSNELKEYLKTQLHPHLVPKFFFQTLLNFEGQLKPRRSQLKILAHELYLKSIFSFDYEKKENSETIVFFHGFLGDKEDFKKIAQNITGDFSFLFISLPGHGETKIENFYSLLDIFKKLEFFIRLFVNTPHFYGYSMGGRIALQLAFHYIVPKSLILESTGLGLKSTEEKKERYSQDLNLFSSHTIASTFLKQWYQNSLFDIYRRHESFNREIQKKSLHPLLQWRESQKYLSQGFFPLINENIKLLKKCTFPIFYIYGSEDKKYQEFARYFQASTVIPGAGHNPNKTHPLEIAKIASKKLK